MLFDARGFHHRIDKWEHPRKADVVSKVAGDFRGWENLATYAKAFPRFLDALNRPSNPPWDNVAQHGMCSIDRSYAVFRRQ